MRKKNVIHILLAIILVALLIPIILLSLNYCVYNYEERDVNTVNLSIAESCVSELDVYWEIMEKCSQEIDQKPLTRVKTTIDRGKIKMEFNFCIYVDGSAEGGRIKQTIIGVDFNKKQIESIENFNGSSKGRSGGIEPITDLTILNYKNTLLKEITSSKSKISTLDIKKLSVTIYYSSDHTNIL